MAPRDNPPQPIPNQIVWEDNNPDPLDEETERLPVDTDSDTDSVDDNEHEQLVERANEIMENFAMAEEERQQRHNQWLQDSEDMLSFTFD